MRAIFTTCFALLCLIAAHGALAQNTPANKPVDPKAAAPSEAVKNTDAKKPADNAKPAAGEQKPAGNKVADAKTAEGKAAEGKPVDTKSADKGPSGADNSLKKSAKTDGPPCVVAEFRALGMDVSDPGKRRTQASTWLKKRAKNCSVDQLLMIRNNRAQWLGTADSASLASEVDALLEAIAADNPQVSTLLYGTPPPVGEGQ